MYRTVNDFLTDWKYESASTLKIFKSLSDESLDKKVHDDVRSLGFLAWHITHTLREMMLLTGLDVKVKDQEDYTGESVKEICEAYEQGAKSLAEEVSKNWSDADLEKEDDMYGQKWKRGTTLQILIRHEAHHRAEMFPLMRLAGLKPVGVYGPTKEEWVAFGREPMK
ncbi:MAG: DinB family protein [Bacteroidetes bacterium]|nr:DinB family protein [Bacteroidota bacterium]